MNTKTRFHKWTPTYIQGQILYGVSILLTLGVVSQIAMRLG